MAEEREWDKGWPDWQDDGRRVETERDDGSFLQGKLCFDDFTAGPDESPIWQILLDSGEVLSFAGELKHWRFLGEKK